VQPKVSIVWLNYNSAKFLDLALHSLKSLFELGYDNYEVIIVDNGSTDGSFEVIRGFC
jgi:glycosyltransferase involved in cell wall biosynthesis